MSDSHEIVPAESREIVAPSHNASGDMSSILSQIVLDNPTPEVLERTLAVWERIQANEAKIAYNEARSRLREDLPTYIANNRRGPSNSYSYADAYQIMASVEPALRKHGFDWGWETDAEGRLQIVTCLLTYGAHTARCTQKSNSANPNKLQSEAQAVQATVTYLKRQTLLSILGIVTADMPDADDAPPEESPQEEARVDQAKTNTVVTRLRKRGVELKDAEAFLGKPVREWTKADLGKLTELIAKKAPASSVHADEPPPDWKPSNGALFDDDDRGPEGR